ncbi:MAG: protein kinase [Deltaproteobacteria bacterium]|nr:protein kinase [Deltaproteobacteria bacterium]
MRCKRCYRRVAEAAACPQHPPEDPSRQEVVAFRSGWAALRGDAPAIPGIVAANPLGRGGFAEVWAGRMGEREVAVKVAHAVGDERLAREAAALGRLEGSAPALHGAGTLPDGRPYLVLERLFGVTLAAHMAAQPGSGAFPVDDAMSLLERLADKMDDVHAAGVVHRDLKPENVFLRTDGLVCLLDFGLAAPARRSSDAPAAVETALRAELTRTGEQLGTIAYMAPEQCLEARDVGPAADLYALAVVAHELLTGRPPFVGDPALLRQAHVGRRPPRASELAPISAAVDDVLLKALAKDPAARFPSAKSFVAALTEAAFAKVAPRATSSTSTSSRCLTGLLYFRTMAPESDLHDVLRAEGGRVARFDADRRIVAFPGYPTPAASVRAALAVARRLVAREDIIGPLHVHAALLRVRGKALHGSALDRPDDWPVVGNGPVCLTPAAEALAGGPHASRRRVSFEGPEVMPLRGRDELLQALAAHAQRVQVERVPALVTVLGHVGYGKTRVLSAVGASLEANGFCVTSFAPRPPSAGDPDGLLVSLLRSTLVIPHEFPTADEVRDACARCLSEETASVSWVAVAYLLRSLPAGDEAVAAVLAAPYAVRHAVSKAIGEALRRAAASAPVAVLVDDGHHADLASLDALEIATLAEGAGAALLVVVAAPPELLGPRPAWSGRAGEKAVHELSPLDIQATRVVLLDHMRPVEHVPELVLDRLHGLTQGVPLFLVEVARALREGGAIRPHPGGEGWYVAADELLEVSPTPLAERLAIRTLGSLPPALIAMAHWSAVLGDEVSPHDLEELERALPANARPRESLDARVALDRLVKAGLLGNEGGGKYRFAHPFLRQALEARMPPEERVLLHRAGLDRLAGRSRDSALLSRIARHATACGDREAAAAAYLELAEDARQRNAFVDADQCASAAIVHLDEADAERRGRALAIRGKVRYRLQRFADAADDLRAARALAQARGDDAAVVDALLEEATLRDWLYEWDLSAELAEMARLVASRLGDPAVDARLIMATGRTHWRSGRVEEAIACLGEATCRADEVGDHETGIISLTLLVCALAHAGRDEEAERRSDDLLSRCSRTGDRLHACVCLINRGRIWLEKRNHDRYVEDVRTAMILAREIGNAQLERVATFNLAEVLHWKGDAPGARSLCVRAQKLEALFRGESAIPHEALLLARLAVAAGDPEEARRHLAWIRERFTFDQLDPLARALINYVDLLSSELEGDLAPAERWDAVVSEVSASGCENELLEVLFGSASVAIEKRDHVETGRRLARARGHAASAPGWLCRLARLEKSRLDMPV